MEPTFFTIFTSVYNRKHTIHRVWESLMNQTNKNFEWIVINNESVDGIEPLLDEYKLRAKGNFEVKIIHQKNLGKFRAFDSAIDMAKGELFIPADSDDSFVPNTIERFDEIWNEYKNEDISGITCLCQNEDGSIVGDKFPVDGIGISDYENIIYKHKIKGEKWGCVRIDVLKKHRFPTQFDVKYFPDTIIWAPIGFNYKTVYVNEPLRVYFQDAGNQITKVKKASLEDMRMQNFFTLWRINYVFPKINKYISSKEYVRMFVFLWQTAFKGKIPVSQVIQKLEKTKSKIVALVLLVPSYFLKKKR